MRFRLPHTRRSVLVLCLCYLLVTVVAVSVCLGLWSVDYFFSSMAFLFFCAYRFERPARVCMVYANSCPARLSCRSKRDLVIVRGLKLRPFWHGRVCVRACAALRVAGFSTTCALCSPYLPLPPPPPGCPLPTRVLSRCRSIRDSYSIAALLLLGSCFLVLGCLLQRRICRVLATGSCSARLTARMLRLNVVRLWVRYRRSLRRYGSGVRAWCCRM